MPHLGHADNEIHRRILIKVINRIAAIASPRNKLRGTVHGSVELGLHWSIFWRLCTRLVLVDQPVVQVGVDSHLLAGHFVQT